MLRVDQADDLRRLVSLSSDISIQICVLCQGVLRDTEITDLYKPP